MSRTMLAGAAALVVAPLLEIVASLVNPTGSDEAADQVAAFVDHRGAAVLGATLEMIALGLLVAGTVWLALVLARRSSGLATWGGILAVFSYFVIAFENGTSLAAAAITTVLSPAQATTALHAIEHSAGVSAVEPLSVLGIVGFVLLALGLRRTAAPIWAAVGLTVGTAIETIGFAVSTRALVVAGFAVLAVSAAAVVRAFLAGETAEAPAVQAVAGAAR